MNERNPIVYFEEDGYECLASHDWCGKIFDVIPHVTEGGHLNWVEFVLENAPDYGKYFIAYQRSFKIRLQDGQEFEFKGTTGDVEDDKVFNKEFLKFVEDYHNGKYEVNESKLQVTNEVEFMDI
jgi:hypothetical protein